MSEKEEGDEDQELLVKTKPKTKHGPAERTHNLNLVLVSLHGAVNELKRHDKQNKLSFFICNFNGKNRTLHFNHNTIDALPIAILLRKIDILN